MRVGVTVFFHRLVEEEESAEEQAAGKPRKQLDDAGKRGVRQERKRDGVLIRSVSKAVRASARCWSVWESIVGVAGEAVACVTSTDQSVGGLPTVASADRDPVCRCGADASGDPSNSDTERAGGRCPRGTHSVHLQSSDDCQLLEREPR